MSLGYITVTIIFRMNFKIIIGFGYLFGVGKLLFSKIHVFN